MLDQIVSRLQDCKVLVVDLETTGLKWNAGDKIAGIAIHAPELEYSIYIPFRHGVLTSSYESQGNLSLDDMCLLYNLLANPDREYYTWNGKFDMLFLQHEGFPLLERNVVYHDVMTALHLLDENRKRRGLNYKLKDAARQFLGQEYGEAEDELKDELEKRGMKKGSMALLPYNLVERYAVADVEITWKLWEFFKPYLEEWMQLDLFNENSLFMSSVLLRMEYEGMLVDTDLIKEHMVRSSEEADKIASDVLARTPMIRNLNSPAQISSALNLPDARRATLERSINPVAQDIVAYKFMAKANNTFYRPYLTLAEGDGKLHPSLHIIGTVSGRLSCSEPNLQQVPRESNRYHVKEVFVAPEGYVFAQYDYAQLELRLACHFAQEKTMTDMFNNGEDLHQYTADNLGVDRYTGKTMNFGLLYGMGPDKAAVYLGIPLEDARQLVPAWHGLYPSFRAAHNSIMRIATQKRTPTGAPQDPSASDGHRFVRLMDGRVRHVNSNDDIFSTWNFLIQGTGAILMRRSLNRIAEVFPYSDRRVIPILTVHDSFIAYIDERYVEEISQEIIGIMVDFPRFNPKMEVDVKTGKSWGELS